MCYHGVPESTCCMLCKVDDHCTTASRADATDRLAKCVICFGHTWTRSDQTASQLVTEGGYTLVDGVCTLPYKGVVDMFTHTLVSDPVVVHSWCAQCVAQVPSTSNTWSNAVLDQLDAPTTSGRGTCIFCGEGQGWKTRCLLQTSSAGRCKLCGVTSWFHPSCAVWAGMQRTCRVEGYGMLCASAKTKKWRDALFPGLSTYLDYASGINWFVNGSTPLVPPAGTRLKGERYNTSNASRRRAGGLTPSDNDPLRSAIVECMHSNDAVRGVDLLRTAVLDAIMNDVK